MTKTTLAAPASSALLDAKFQPEIQPEGCASDAFIKAVKNGDLNVAKAIYEQDPDQATCTSEIVQLAAMSGNVELLDWTHSRTPDDCTNAFLHYAMERVCFKEGHLQVLKWIHDHAYHFAAPAMFRGATNSGNLETVLWTIDNYPDAYELSKCIRMDNAACYDNLPMIKWLHERDFFFSKTAMDNASTVEILEFLNEHQIEGCTDEIVTKAVAKSNVPVLEWFQAKSASLWTSMRSVRSQNKRPSRRLSRGSIRLSPKKTPQKTLKKTPRMLLKKSKKKH